MQHLFVEGLYKAHIIMGWIDTPRAQLANSCLRKVTRVAQ